MISYDLFYFQEMPILNEHADRRGAWDTLHSMTEGLEGLAKEVGFKIRRVSKYVVKPFEIKIQSSIPEIFSTDNSYHSPTKEQLTEFREHLEREIPGLVLVD